MIKCPKCKSFKVARTYVESVYKTIGVNDQEVYEIAEIGLKLSEDHTEFYCSECFHEWDWRD